MKATGIVRRVDDLGRIVIPKEIRRTLKIREGEPSRVYLHIENPLPSEKGRGPYYALFKRSVRK